MGLYSWSACMGRDSHVAGPQSWPLCMGQGKACAAAVAGPKPCCRRHAGARGYETCAPHAGVPCRHACHPPLPFALQEDCLDDAFSDAPPCTGLGLCLREPTDATPPPAKRPRVMSEGAPLGDPLNSTKGAASPLMLPARAGADGGSVAGASAAAARAPLPSISNCGASMAASGAAAGAGEERARPAAPPKGAICRTVRNGGAAAGMERRGPVTRGRQAERSKQAERGGVVADNGQAEASRPAKGEAAGADAPARRSTQSEKAIPRAYKEFCLPPAGALGLVCWPAAAVHMLCWQHALPLLTLAAGVTNQQGCRRRPPATRHDCKAQCPRACRWRQPLAPHPLPLPLSEDPHPLRHHQPGPGGPAAGGG